MGEWRDMTLGSIATQDGYGLVDGPFGSNLPASLYTEEGVPVIRGSNLSLGTSRFRAQEFVFVSHETAKRLERSLCRPLDIVFTKKGTLGQTGLVPDSGKYEQYLLSSNQMKLTVDRRIAVPLYVYYFVSSPKSTQKIIRDADSTGVPKTNVAYLREFPIRLPAVSKQRAIASVLGALDDKIEQNRRTAQALERLARAIFHAWFVDFEPVKAKAAGATSFPSMPQPVFNALPTRFVDSGIGPVPEGWEVKPLSKACTLVSGGTPMRSESSYWGGSIPWYSVKDAPAGGNVWVAETSETITEEGLANSAARLLPKGGTIISARGTVGKIAMVCAPMAFNQSCYGLLPADGQAFGYLYQLMESTVGELQQRTHGSVFDTITRATFDGLMVVSPAQEVVSAYTLVATPLFDAMLSLKHESVKVAQMRDYLLPKLLSGQIRVRDAERAAATVA